MNDNRQLVKGLIRDKRNSVGDTEIFDNMIWHAFTNRESVNPLPTAADLSVDWPEQIDRRQV